MQDVHILIPHQCQLHVGSYIYMETLTPDHFEILAEIGQGSFGQVVKAKKIDSNDIFAIKIVEKAHLKRENKVKQAHVEKNLLLKLRSHPGIIKLHYTFQDTQCLYFVLELCENGDLVSLISRLSVLPYDLAVQYASELVATLEYLRANQVAHRDLKPENILISSSGHIRIVDFGSARDYTNEEEKGAVLRRNTFVGTAEYVSPEVLADQEVGPPVDLWALGCILYQMLVGHPPFTAKNDYLIFEQIRNLSVKYPDTMPPAAVDLIRKLLVLNPRARLGAGEPGTATDFEALKTHQFFAGVDFNSVFMQEIVLPQVPAPSPPIVTPAASESDGAQILVSGVVKKKAGWVYKQRRLDISSEPKIGYYDPGTGVLKGEIEITPELRVDIRNKYEFHIITPKRTYYFKEISGHPERWATAIASIVANLGQK